MSPAWSACLKQDSVKIWRAKSVNSAFFRRENLYLNTAAIVSFTNFTNQFRRAYAIVSATQAHACRGTGAAHLAFFFLLAFKLADNYDLTATPL